MGPHFARTNKRQSRIVAALRENTSSNFSCELLKILLVAKNYWDFHLEILNEGFLWVRFVRGNTQCPGQATY